MTAVFVKSVQKQTKGPRAVYWTQEYLKQSCNVYLAR